MPKHWGHQCNCTEWPKRKVVWSEVREITPVRSCKDSEFTWRITKRPWRFCEKKQHGVLILIYAFQNQSDCWAAINSVSCFFVPCPLWLAASIQNLDNSHLTPIRVCGVNVTASEKDIPSHPLVDIRIMSVGTTQFSVTIIKYLRKST
jgi:hypothetical protein